MPGRVCFETVTFTECADATILTRNTVFQSAEDRDTALLSAWPKGSANRRIGLMSCWHGLFR